MRQQTVVLLLLALAASQLVCISSYDDGDDDDDDDDEEGYLDDNDRYSNEEEGYDDDEPLPTPAPIPSPQLESICGRPQIQPSIDSRIVGGDVAKPNSFPWQISLMKQGSYGAYHTCGGSFIRHHWVITAAHCVFEDPRASEYLVILGEHDRSRVEGTEQKVRVSEIHVHKDYVGRPNFWQNDVALLRLDTDVTFNKYILPVCLPKNDSTADIVGCYSTGWGRDETNGKPLVTLNQVTMKYYAYNQCSQPDWYGDMITTNMLCGGNAEGGKGTCQGDSGGPFVCRGRQFSCWTLHGLTSWAKGGCASKNHPTIFTRVGRYLNWINARIAN